MSGAPLFGLFFTNSKEGILKDNYKLRQAIQMALGKDRRCASRSAPRRSGARRARSSRGQFLVLEAGIERYNQHDPVKAKELAAEAGYDGTPIRLLTSTNYQTHFDQATVFVRQLAEAGHQRPADRGRLGDPAQDARRAHAMGHLRDPSRRPAGPDPDHLPQLGLPRLVGQPRDRAVEEGVHRHRRSRRAQGGWDKIQALFYEQVPAIKVGDAYSYDLMSPKLQGVGPQIFWPTFWNVSLKD